MLFAARGAAVAAMIVGIDVISGRVEKFGETLVAQRMLAHPM